jgi:hypothetical protein
MKKVFLQRKDNKKSTGGKKVGIQKNATFAATISALTFFKKGVIMEENCPDRKKWASRQNDHAC